MTKEVWGAHFLSHTAYNIRSALYYTMYVTLVFSWCYVVTNSSFVLAKVFSWCSVFAICYEVPLSLQNHQFCLFLPCCLVPRIH